MKTHFLSVYLFFLATSIWAPNPNLHKQVVSGFPFTYQQLIDYVNATEFLLNNQIRSEHLPVRLREMRKTLHSAITTRAKPDEECLVIILEKEMGIESDEFARSVLQPSLESILNELLVLEEAGIITPQQRYRSPRTVIPNPEDEAATGFSTPSLATSDRDSSDFDEDYGLDEEEPDTDDDGTLSTLSSLSSRSASPRIKGLAIIQTPASLGSSQSWPDVS